MNNPFVIVIAGPPAVGKTTIINMLKERFDCVHISEDDLAKELFPDIYINIEDYPDKQKIVEEQLITRMVDTFKNGKYVVIDRINIDKQFVETICQLFADSLILKVLYPPIEVSIERDKRRECWTSGEATIRDFYKQYNELKPLIGESNYIDNSEQTPEDTLAEFSNAMGESKKSI